MIVSLSGFTGCGKSSVGKRLATLLECRFIDLDEYIEAREQRKIPEIFKSDGEAFFREQEYEALTGIVNENDSNDGGFTILSLGGGTVTTRKCREIIKSGTQCIYLKASTDTLASNLERDWESRPLISKTSGNRQNLKQAICTIFNSRAKYYEECAERTVETDGKSIDFIAEEIYNTIIRLYER